MNDTEEFQFRWNIDVKDQASKPVGTKKCQCCKKHFVKSSSNHYCSQCVIRQKKRGSFI